MNDLIAFTKSSGNSGMLIDGITETVKHEIKKKQESRYLGALSAPLCASLVQPVISSVAQGIIGIGIKREIKFFSYTPSFKKYQD